ncbi:MAG: hypothetical protein HUU60_01410 [Armatimonadetes bacterium]|nr:hypothetical protein [Armatimonadota bacterium]
MSSKHDPTSRRQFLTQGFRSLARAGFGGFAERLENAFKSVTEPATPRILRSEILTSAHCFGNRIHRGEFNLDRLVEHLREIGAQGLEMSDAYLRTSSHDEIEALRMALFRNELHMSAMEVTQDFDIADEAIRTQRANDAARRIEIYSLAPFSVARIVGPGSQISLVDYKECLRSLYAASKATGVRIAIEVDPSNCDELLSLIDPANPQLLGIAFADAIDWDRSFERLFHVRLGLESRDTIETARRLRERGYAGPISLICQEENADQLPDLIAELKTLETSE